LRIHGIGRVALIVNDGKEDIPVLCNEMFRDSIGDNSCPMFASYFIVREIIHSNVKRFREWESDRFASAYRRFPIVKYIKREKRI